MENKQNEFENNLKTSKGFINQFLNFDSFITPSIIKFIYMLGVIFFALIGLMSIIAGLGRYGSGLQVLFGLITIALSHFIPRITAEILIVNFKILQVLQDIHKKM